MDGLDPTAGAAGQGFISGMAGPFLLLALLVMAMGVPAIREAIARYAGTARDYFFGSQPATTEQNPETDAGIEAGGDGTLASSRDVYDFDLSLLDTDGACDVDASSAGS